VIADRSSTSASTGSLRRSGARRIAFHALHPMSSQVALQRDQGLTHGEIGRCLGVTRQCVQLILRKMDGGPARQAVVLCHVCHEEAGRLDRKGPKALPVLCLRCLEKAPTTDWGQRLRAHRIAAGLTARELALRLGVAPSTVVSYESGRASAPPGRLAALEAELGSAVLPQGCHSLRPLRRN
jgi:DNA-binding XRE family transcriptional regulator